MSNETSGILEFSNEATIPAVKPILPDYRQLQWEASETSCPICKHKAEILRGLAAVSLVRSNQSGFNILWARCPTCKFVFNTYEDF